MISENKTNASISSRLTKWIIYFGLMLLVTFVLSELVFRIYTPVELPVQGLNDPHPILGYKMKPNYLGRQRSREYDVVVRTNSLGLRGSELLPRQSYTKRILILGDSFTFGHGAVEDESFGELAEAVGRTGPGS